MNTRMLVIGTSVALVLLLVGVGVFISHNMNASAPIKVYELPDSTSITEYVPAPVLAVGEGEVKPAHNTSGETPSAVPIVESSSDTIHYEDELAPLIDDLDTGQVAIINESAAVEDSEHAAALNPPTPPTRGLVNLINATPDDSTGEELEQRIMEYTRTYYPLTVLEPHEVSLLDPQAKAAYERQQAAAHKEAMDMIKETFGSMPLEILATFPADMMNTFEKEGLLP